VRRAVPGDLGIVRGLRLEALADAPEAFDSTLEGALAWTAPDWERWLARGATFVLEAPEGPRGIAAGVPHDADPAAVFLESVWVHPSRRGTGAADALVAAVLAWAREEGAAEVLLHVGRYNDRARRCYERNGFLATGREIVRGRDGLVEIEMEARIPTSPRKGSRPNQAIDEPCFASTPLIR
jgi:GNAT superfamily N-acetyltransferase